MLDFPRVRSGHLLHFSGRLLPRYPVSAHETFTLGREGGRKREAEKREREGGGRGGRMEGGGRGEDRHGNIWLEVLMYNRLVTCNF